MRGSTTGGTAELVGTEVGVPSGGTEVWTGKFRVGSGEGSGSSLELPSSQLGGLLVQEFYPAW
ncbi:MAG: hypothetical protein CL902_03555 [Dehalococcoidia bacterium]|nr:hypothetical protein [Dehalococcoidia bacterium]